MIPNDFRDHRIVLVVTPEFILPYLQYVKGVANHTTNTTRNGSSQKFHVEGSIGTSSKVISNRSVGCFKPNSTSARQGGNQTTNP